MPDRWVTLDEIPERGRELDAFNRRFWPEFLLHGDIRNWYALFDELAPFQNVLLDEDDRFVALGLTAPAWFDPDRALPQTLDEVLVAARWPAERPTVLCALAAVVSHERRATGLSRDVLRRMIATAARHGARGVIAPVRPTLKATEPNADIVEYADRRRPDGTLFDPWLRVHESIGGRRLGIASKAFRVAGTVDEWRSWTGAPLETSGAHAVEGALVPVEIDLESDTGVYVEPNVWYFHEV